eukprot:11831395-Ditylum_brightwellii.AAC.1
MRYIKSQQSPSCTYVVLKAHIEENTSMQFVRNNSTIHNTWVILVDYEDDVTWSFFGRMKKEGWQKINLDTDWGLDKKHGVGTAIHEL